MMQMEQLLPSTDPVDGTMGGPEGNDEEYPEDWVEGKTSEPGKKLTSRERENIEGTECMFSSSPSQFFGKRRLLQQG